MRKEGVNTKSPAKPWGSQGLVQGRKCPVSWRGVCLLQNLLDAAASSALAGYSLMVQMEYSSEMNKRSEAK